MIILQVCHFISSCPGNFISSLECLENKLDQLGHETIYVFPEPAKDTSWCKNIQKRRKVYFIPYTEALKKISTYIKLRKIFKENRINVVHSHYDVYDFPVTLMAPKNTKIFLHLHNALPEDYWAKGGIVRKLKYTLGRYVYKKAYLISVSDYYRNIACKKRFRREQSTILVNGVVLKNIPKTECTTKKYDFLTFASDFYGKGADIIIKASKKLKDDGYNFKVLLCGGGRETGWKDLDDYLSGETTKQNWLETTNVVNDVGSLYSVSSSFISASRRETFSLSVCEAAYAGIKVVSSDIPGLEWAKEIPTVKFFKDGDWNELYKCMKSILDNKHSIYNKIEESRKIIEEKYSINLWVENLVHIYTTK
ncbi:glycosyltransferase family 4 protein [Clostridium frigoris]|uniref:Glycosyltransferase family 4 protein n=1 Tax=Clostridium frigoris TaxID=205327 RepID=A0ABS6BSF4_9CLOT|nr:glycosyltransferase family 4 protein [Clostridium frigoris]MBU3159857.1 glycosyltransferase family 4 protein [Clostridium frigoris]